MTQPSRFLIVPEIDLDGDKFLRAEATSDESRQEAGVGVAQPTPGGDPPMGDIRPLLSGEPETHIAGSIQITKSGPVERGRFSWVKDGESYLQFRQSPLVVGKAPRVIERSTSAALNRPKLVPLADGDLLCLWLEQTQVPVREGSINGTARKSYLRASTQTWDAPDDMGDGVEAPAGFANWGGLAAVQFPDTQEVVAVGFFQDTRTSTPVTRMRVWSSSNDGGSWEERRFLRLSGTLADVELTDDFPIMDCDAVLLDSGRLLVVVVDAKGNIHGLTSDDRGYTWSYSLLKGPLTGWDNDLTGGSISACKARNGNVVVAAAHRYAKAGPTYHIDQRLFVTDGTSVGADIDLVLDDALDVSVCMRPDGYVQLYASNHEEAGDRVDWLMGCTLEKLDPLLSDAVGELFPPRSAGNGFYWHQIDGALASGDLKTTPLSFLNNGFVTLDAVTWRGQVLLVAQVVRHSGAAGANPTIAESTLISYCTNGWQPLQETLCMAGGGTQTPARAFNRTWDCYGTPDFYGFTAAGAGTVTLVSAGADDGYLQIATTANSKEYSDTTVPEAHGSMAAAARAILQVTSGGSTTQDDVALRLFRDDGTDGHGVIVRFKNLGTGATQIVLVDAIAATTLATLTETSGRWIEVFVAIYEDSGGNSKGRLFCRSWDKTNDPDWEDDYQDSTAKNITQAAVGLTDNLAFGSFVTSTATSLWKAVHAHFPTADPFPNYSPAERRTAASFFDSESHSEADGVIAVDDGIENVMRTPIMTCAPSQWLTRGVYAVFRGEAITAGDYDFAARYDYAGRSAFEGSASQEWRSVDDDVAVELVLDAGSSGTPFRPEAVALFGINFPDVEVQLNDVDSSVGWAAPALSCRVAHPGASGTVNRYSHLWAFDDPGGGWSATIGDHRVSLTTPNGIGNVVWEPHQFYSQETGPKFYLVVNSLIAGTVVYRIVDNTERALILATDPQSIMNGAIDTWSIHSDRIAFHISPAYVDSAAVGYRYMRFLIRAVDHQDSDEDFYRIGRVIAGRLAELSNPDFEWGWTIEQQPGYSRVDSVFGPTFTKRRHSPRRVWSCDYGHHMPTAEMDAQYESPIADGTPQSWPAIVDLLRRMEGFGRVGALCFEGNRVERIATEIKRPVLADPRSLALARIEDMGTVQHVGWRCANMNLSTGDDMVPRPIAEIRRLVFREEL